MFEIDSIPTLVFVGLKYLTQGIFSLNYFNEAITII